MVYRLLRSLNGRASTMEIIKLAKKRHPQSPLYARVREQLDKLEVKGYVSRDKSRLPYVWVITKKLEEAQRDEGPSAS